MTRRLLTVGREHFDDLLDDLEHTLGIAAAVRRVDTTPSRTLGQHPLAKTPGIEARPATAHLSTVTAIMRSRWGRFTLRRDLG